MTWTVEKTTTCTGVEITWVEDENGFTVCDLYHKIPQGFFIKDDAEKYAPLLAASPEMRDLLKAFIAATEGVFECGNIRTEAMNLMKRIEPDE